MYVPYQESGRKVCHTPYRTAFDGYKGAAELYRLLFENSEYSNIPYKIIKNVIDFAIPKSAVLRNEWIGREKYCFLYIVSGAQSVVQEWLKKDTPESPHEIAVMIYSLVVSCLNVEKGGLVFGEESVQQH